MPDNYKKLLGIPGTMSRDTTVFWMNFDAYAILIRIKLVNKKTEDLFFVFSKYHEILRELKGFRNTQELIDFVREYFSKSIDMPIELDYHCIEKNSSVKHVSCFQESGDDIAHPESGDKFCVSSLIELDSFCYIASDLVYPEYLDENISRKIVGSLSKNLNEDQTSKVSIVFSEMFNNALDHGVLGIPSVLKDNTSGFEEFINARRSALAVSQDGVISIEVKLNFLKESELPTAVFLSVMDNGGGLVELDRSLSEADRKKYHGRGLKLIQHLSKEIGVDELGKRIYVVL